jgi:hypothetical protein
MDAHSNLAMLYHPDPLDQTSIIKGIKHRVGCLMPAQCRYETERFRTFCRHHFRYFNKCDDWMTHAEWLKGSSYNEQRKKQVMDADKTWASPHNAECFIKDEFYEEVKAPRSIMAYNDKMKYQLGPFIKSLEKKFFSHKFFVKGMDDKQRDEKLDLICGDNNVGFTDFSSFESHHRGIYAELFVEFVNYLRDGCGTEEFRLFKDVVLGCNHLVYPKVGITAKVPQRLMSGALWTSFQNSFLNIFILKYLKFRANSYRFDWDDLDMMVEGDDGIFKAFNIRRSIIDKLGLKLKLKYANHYRYASFCGRVVTDNVCVTDPMKLIMKLMWIKMRYSGSKATTLNGLLKSKAMSYATSYRNAPIIHALCYDIYNKTKRYDHRKSVMMMDGYDRGKALSSVHVVQPPDVPGSARELVEQLYGISANQQLSIENAIKTHSGLHYVLPFEYNNMYVENLYSSLIHSPRGLTG